MAAPGAVLRGWSPAEVCEFITLTVSDPRIQITGQSHKIVSQSEASCSRPPQTPIPLNQDPGDGPGPLQWGAHSFFFQFCKAPLQPPSNFPTRVLLRRFCALRAGVLRQAEQRQQQQTAKPEPRRAARPASTPQGLLRAGRSCGPDALVWASDHETLKSYELRASA